jgi:putative transposase
MVWSFVYVALCRLLQLVALLCRSERSKELEILLLRHELAILRRRPRRAPIRPVDRVILERSRGRYRGAPGQAVGESGDGSALASPAGQAAVDVGWGSRRIVGELRGLGISISATSVRTILIRHGLPLSPQRDELSWQRERIRRALDRQRASRVPRSAGHLQPVLARARASRLCPSLRM